MKLCWLRENEKKRATTRDKMRHATVDETVEKTRNTWYVNEENSDKENNVLPSGQWGCHFHLCGVGY